MPSIAETLLRNISHRCATRLYPAERREPFPGARADVSFDPSECRLCGTCARKCPTGAIAVEKDDRIWSRDPFSCIFCGDCIDTCPKSCLSFAVRPPGPVKRHQQGIVRTKVPERRKE